MSTGAARGVQKTGSPQQATVERQASVALGAEMVDKAVVVRVWGGQA